MTPVLLLLATLALQDAPAAPASPVSTSPAAAEPAAASASPALTGAPADDYGFVAWCRGALTGHMELFQSASPEIARVREQKARVLLTGKSGAEAEKIQASLAKDAAREDELDIEQHKAGEDYLTLYQSALTAAEAAGSPHARGEEAASQGYRIWSAARASDGKTQMYSYLMWELPGRCETAAKSLKEKSSLFGAAFRKAEAAPAPPDPAAAPADAPPADATVAAPSDPAASAQPAPPPPSPAPEAPPAPALRPSAPSPGA